MPFLALSTELLAAIVGLAVIGTQAVILLLFSLGVKAFKSWFMSEVINPHVSPIKTTVEKIERTNESLSHRLEEHDKAIKDYSTYTLMLLGKVFGGKPDLSVMDLIDEPHTPGETPLTKKE